MNNEPVAWMDSPKKIYLIVSEDDFFYCKNYRELEDIASKGEGVLWCEDSQNDTDIEYVRADLTHPAKTLTDEEMRKVINENVENVTVAEMVMFLTVCKAILRKAQEK